MQTKPFISLKIPPKQFLIGSMLGLLIFFLSYDMPPTKVLSIIGSLFILLATISFENSYRPWLSLLALLIPLHISISIGPAVSIPFFIFVPTVLIFCFYRSFHSTPKSNLLFTELILIIFGIVCILSILRSIYVPIDYSTLRGNPHEKAFMRSLLVVIAYMSCVSLSLILPRMIIGPRHFKQLIFILQWTGILLATYCSIAWIGGTFGLLPPLPLQAKILLDAATFNENIKLYRIIAFSHEPSTACRHFVLIFFLILISWHKKKILTVLLLAPILIGILLTFSRAGWLGLIAGILTIVIIKLILSPYKTRIAIVSTLFVLSIASIGNIAYTVSPTAEELIDRLFINSITKDEERGVVDMSRGIRLANNKAALQAFNDYPIWGIGMGNFLLHSHNYHVYIPWISDKSNGVQASVSNIYYFLLAETGLAGFISYLLFWISLVITFIKKIITSQNKTEQHLLSCFLAGNISLIIHGLFFSPFHFDLWFFVGLSLYALQCCSQKKPLLKQQGPFPCTINTDISN